MDPFHQVNDEILMIKKWMDIDPNLKVGITTRIGGVSHEPYDTLNLGFHVPDEHQKVLNNRRTIAYLLNQPLQHWVMGQQVHRTNIAEIKEQDLGKGSQDHKDAIKDMDGIMTKKQDVLCTALFADCVPIYYFDPQSKWIGIAHAGWRGTVNGIASNMIGQFKKNMINTDRLLVAIGPCISASNYEVDEQVINHIPPKLRKTELVVPKDNGRFLLDLRNLNKRLLIDSGVPEKNISTSSFCTYNDQDLFFSHRRDHGKTGRMLGFIGYTS